MLTRSIKISNRRLNHVLIYNPFLQKLAISKTLKSSSFSSDLLMDYKNLCQQPTIPITASQYSHFLSLIVKSPSNCSKLVKQVLVCINTFNYLERYGKPWIRHRCK